MLRAQRRPGTRRAGPTRVDKTTYVCNGADGKDGADGLNGTNGLDGADGGCNVAPERGNLSVLSIFAALAAVLQKRRR